MMSMLIPALRPQLTALALSVALLAPAVALAESAEEKGLRIAKESDARDDGFQDYTQTLTMTLRTKAGQEAVRELRFKVLEVPGDGDKSLTIFDQPKDVEGTALLTFAHKVGDDDIWLFLPALKRVKRIAGSNKSGPFMGSEFAFEDISSTEIEKYKYKFLRDDKFDGRDFHVVEAIPLDKNSGYSRTEVWFDTAELRAEKVDYFNKRGDALKTQVASGWKKYLDRYWYPDRIEMVNHQSGRSTTLLNRNYKFRNGYTARDFDQASLEAAR